MIPDGNCLREGRAKIGVLLASVSRVPAGVHIEPQEVGEPADLLGPGRRAAWQRSKRVEVDWLRAFRLQIGVQEGRMAQLIIGIVADVLGHVTIEILKCSLVGRISSCGSPQLVVLLPQIALDEFGRRQKSQDCNVASGKCVVFHVLSSHVAWDHRIGQGQVFGHRGEPASRTLSSRARVAMRGASTTEEL